MGWRVQFLLLSATWGSSFLFIKVLDRHWPALWVAFGRVALGAATLLVLAVVRRERLAFDRRTWLHLLVAAALFNAIPFVLFAYGEKHVPSIVAGLWNATAPLWVVAFALLAFPEEHPTASRVAGLVVGFVGVAVLLGPWRGVHGSELQGQLACAGAGVCYGLAWLYTRRYLASGESSGIALSAGQLLCAVALLGVTIPFAAPPTAHIGPDGLASILTLGVLGTGVAYLFNYAIIRAAGATTAATVTYVVPLFSTILGVVVLSEPVVWNQPVGALILLLGVAVSQGAFSPGARAGPAADGSGSPRRWRRRARPRRGSAGQPR
jgi:drug/metabolite transporter (DMT)-like permease